MELTDAELREKEIEAILNREPACELKYEEIHQNGVIVTSLFRVVPKGR